MFLFVSMFLLCTCLVSDVSMSLLYVYAYLVFEISVFLLVSMFLLYACLVNSNGMFLLYICIFVVLIYLCFTSVSLYHWCISFLYSNLSDLQS